MNKEQLSKEFEDCWDAAHERSLYDNVIYKKRFIGKIPEDKDQWITTRLAALDKFVNEHSAQIAIRQIYQLQDDVENIKHTPLELLYFIHKIAREAIKQSQPLDDGQEGKGLGKAEKIKLFKDLWYNRNPVHENNANTGEDMFWGTAMLVAEEFVAALPVADGEGEKVGNVKELPEIKALDVAINNLVHGLPTNSPDAFKEIQRLFWNIIDPINRLLPSTVTGGVKDWKRGDVFTTTFWGVSEVCIIQKFTNTEVFFIRLESIKSFKEVKKDYCAAGLRKEIFDKINKTFIHHSDWYTEYRHEIATYESPTAPTLTPLQIWNKAIMVADNVCHNRVNIFNGSMGGLWVKASERLPVLPEDKRTIQLCARWVDKPEERFILAYSKNGFSVSDNHLSILEWLDESVPNLQTDAIELCRKEIMYFFNDEYHIKKMLGTEPPEDKGPVKMG